MNSEPSEIAEMSESRADMRGPVEKFLVPGLITFSIALFGIAFSTFHDQMNKAADVQSKQWAILRDQGTTLQSVVTMQAVTNAQLLVLNHQLADVPSLLQRMSQAEVKIDRNSSDIHELQEVKRLR